MAFLVFLKYFKLIWLDIVLMHLLVGEHEYCNGGANDLNTRCLVNEYISQIN